jgi:hypothetical protein
MATQRRRFAVAVPLAVALATTFAMLLQPAFTLAVRQTASGLGLLVAGIRSR